MSKYAHFLPNLPLAVNMQQGDILVDDYGSVYYVDIEDGNVNPKLLVQSFDIFRDELDFDNHVQYAIDTHFISDKPVYKEGGQIEFLRSPHIFKMYKQLVRNQAKFKFDGESEKIETYLASNT